MQLPLSSNDFVCAVAVIDGGVDGVCDPSHSEDGQASNRKGGDGQYRGQHLNAARG